jgi:hypothetical protein
MKRVFFFGVIAYSIAIFLLNDLAAATTFQDAAAAPWIVKCLVDICFAGAGVFALFGDRIDWDEDEEGIHPDDIKVPSVWLYGLFGLNLFCNFGWHGYEFAHLNGALALYNGMWFFVEFIAMGLTMILFRHARHIARREARRVRANQARTPEASPQRPRSVL